MNNSITKITNITSINYNIDNLEEQIISKIIEEQSKSINALIEDACRNNAVPPIKGEITQGKVKWRGLKIHQTNTLPPEIWLTQRGKQISQKIIFA